jgi:hypothetical protein
MRVAPLLAFSLAACAFITVSPADAQRRYYRGADQTERITIIDENGRARTRITVRPRSYLDAGTEVVPGERKFTDYVSPPTYMSGSPYAIWDPSQQYRAPLPLQGWLPGYNPWSW